MIAQVRVDDPETFDRYVAAATPTVQDHGGEAVAVDETPRVVEGDWHGPRTLIVRFASMEAAVGWYESPEYQDAAAIRRTAAATNMAFLTGYEP